jgi:hypothetical protein
MSSFLSFNCGIVRRSVTRTHRARSKRRHGSHSLGSRITIVTAGHHGICQIAAALKRNTVLPTGAELG